MRCVVIDDEPFALDLIKDYIRRTPFLELAGAFGNPFKALSFLNSQRVDLIFLDINMPELSGLELYKSLISPPAVIFTTAYPEFAAESYDYNAVDYLLKPIRYERFLKAVNKASTKAEPKSVDNPVQATTSSPAEEFLFLKSGTSQVKVFPQEVLFVEAAGNYMCFHTREKKIMSLLNMKEATDLLASQNFVRVHKSWLINLTHLEAIEKHDVVVGGHKIPIGVTYREHFFRVIER